MLLKFPNGHDVHDTAASAENVPALQSEHGIAPRALNCPARHLTAVPFVDPAGQ